MKAPSGNVRNPCPSPDTPDQPFLVGWHHFAVDVLDFAVSADRDKRAIAAVPAAIARSLIAAEHDRCVGVTCRRANRCEMVGFQVDRFTEIVGVKFLLKVVVKPSSLGVLQPKWIAGDERLAENDQIAILFASLADPTRDLLDSWFAFQPVRGDLRKSDGQLSRHGILYRSTAIRISVVGPPASPCAYQARHVNHGCKCHSLC